MSDLFDPIKKLQEFFKDLINEFANVAWDWLELFMLKPMDFSDYKAIDTMYNFSFQLAYALAMVFLVWALLQTLFYSMADLQGRSVIEIISKSGLGFILSLSAPWLLDNALIKMNNAVVQFFLAIGLDTKAIEEFAIFPTTATTGIILMSGVIVALFIFLGIQYIIRIGEYIVLVVTAPLAAHSIVTENFDLWSVWWREAVSVICSHCFQVALLWGILNMLTGTEKLEEYIFAAALMFPILRGPKWLRQIIYSTGTGRTAVGLAGGASKMAIYKYAASKITR